MIPLQIVQIIDEAKLSEQRNKGYDPTQQTEVQAGAFACETSV
jgi:hypothetical protein